MPRPKVTDDELMALIERHGIREATRRLKLDYRTVQRRRRRIEAKKGVAIIPGAKTERARISEHQARAMLEVDSGIVLVGSDSHYWPGIVSTAHRAFCRFAKELRPVAIIKNGDELDFPAISRHAPIGWEERPSVVMEIEAAKERLEEIRSACPRAKRFWPLGNHDCLDRETECLTKRGWLKYDELRQDDWVLSKDGDKAVWSPINEIVTYPYVGELVRVEKTRMSIAVTPNHRVLLRRLNWRTAQYDIEEYRRADDLPPWFDVPTAALADGVDLNRDQIALAGWVRVDRSEVFREKYAGVVWCLRVPHGNFVVRRNGCAYFTGNSRYESRLAAIAPEYARIHGVHLKDHFPDWTPCWSVWINNDVVIKHRFKSGIHATHNNALWSGKTIVTGHLHSLRVTPLSDYNGTRFGVDCGTLADPYGPQFTHYTEDNPVNWRSGFVVLTFYRGRLLWPEVVHVIDEGQVTFRGRVYEV